MASLRKIAECLGFSGSFSVLHNFFGYLTDYSGRRISLLRQFQLLQNRYINLNIIRVGIENFTDPDNREIMSAIQTARNLYATVNLGIGRIELYVIPQGNANGRDIVADDAEARFLTDEWSVPNASVDVFVVLAAWPGEPGIMRLGISAIDGPCDKNASTDRTGVVISIQNSDPLITGHLLAHEIGHYLGLRHVCEYSSNPAADNPTNPCLTGGCKTHHEANLMFPCIQPTAVNISNGEFQDMNDHCFVNAGCAGN